jgi:hypothetical protein
MLSNNRGISPQESKNLAPEKTRICPEESKNRGALNRFSPERPERNQRRTELVRGCLAPHRRVSPAGERESDRFGRFLEGDGIRMRIWPVGVVFCMCPARARWSDICCSSRTHELLISMSAGGSSVSVFRDLVWEEHDLRNGLDLPAEI